MICSTTKNHFRLFEVIVMIVWGEEEERRNKLKTENSVIFIFSDFLSMIALTHTFREFVKRG